MSVQPINTPAVANQQRKDKSVLDSRPVVNKAFPSHSDYQESTTTQDKGLEIVGNCPKCGAPVYGNRSIVVGPPIQVQYACQCRSKGDGLLQTKE